MDRTSRIQNSFFTLKKPNTDEALTEYLASHKNVENLNIAELLYFIGDSHKYQKLIICFLACLSITIGIVGSNLPFIFYEPEFVCKRFDGSSYICSQKEACQNQFKFDVIVHRSSIVSDFNLYCDRSLILEHSQALYFFISAFGATIILLLADMRGRLFGLYMMCSGFILGSSLSYNSSSLIGIFIGLGISQTCLLASLGLTSIYINEVIGKLIRFQVEKCSL